jgi:GNAT superfamily N-acetyltransferase
MNNLFYEVTNNNYLISTNPALLDITAIYQYLSQESYWAQNIPLATVEKSVNNSLCFGVYDGTTQIGFARLITDMTTFAYLCDVFIIETYRRVGLSKWLMQTIHAHPELQGLRRWMLRTKDAQGLYQKYGWEFLSQEVFEQVMQWYQPNVYAKD